MLYTPDNMRRDQLLVDLQALRDHLTDPGKWAKGSFGQDQTVCIVAGCELVTEHPLGTHGFHRLDSTNLSEADLRLGRMIYAVYVALYGPEADMDVTLSVAMSKIARFNDSPVATHEAVILLLDRAVAELFEPVAASA